MAGIAIEGVAEMPVDYAPEYTREQIWEMEQAVLSYKTFGYALKMKAMPGNAKMAKEVGSYMLDFKNQAEAHAIEASATIELTENLTIPCPNCKTLVGLKQIKTTDVVN